MKKKKITSEVNSQPKRWQLWASRPKRSAESDELRDGDGIRKRKKKKKKKKKKTIKMHVIR